MLVLGLGIGGATTQFTVVNAIVLRGFSFPHPEQLVTVGLIDPKATDQNNNFGFGMIPTAQDYEDLKAAQKSCSLMAGYLNGSTINVTYKNNPQRYTGGYVTEDFFKITGVSPMLGRDFTAEDNKPGAEKVIILGDEIWRRDFNGDPNIVGQNVRVNGKAATIIGVMPPNFKFPISRNSGRRFTINFRRYRAASSSSAPNNAAPSVMGRLKPGVTLDQANAEFITLARQLAQDNPKTNQNFTSATVQPLAEFAHRRAISADRLGDVGRSHSRFADRVRERDEHAVRPRRIASKRTGDSRRARSDTLATRQANVDRKSGGRGIRRGRWSSSGLLERRFADARHGRAAGRVRIAVLDSIYDRRARARVHSSRSLLVATIVSGLVPALISAHSNAAEMMKEGGRGNSSRLVNVITRLLVIGQIALTAALLIAATLEIKSIRNQIKLDYGYDENAIYSARMALMEGAYTEDGRREFFKRAVRELRGQPAVRFGRAK